MSVTRIDVAAVFDDRLGRVEVGGQVFAGTVPVSGMEVVLRGQWGDERRTRSGALGSFGSHLAAPPTALGMLVIVAAGGVEQAVQVT